MDRSTHAPALTRSDVPSFLSSFPRQHTGAYSCWASAATGDPEHHCYFAEGANSKGMPPEKLCEIDLRRNLYDRYPRLAGPPIDTDLTDKGVVMTQWPVVPPDQRKPLLPWLREAERQLLRPGRGSN